MKSLNKILVILIGLSFLFISCKNNRHTYTSYIEDSTISNKIGRLRDYSTLSLPLYLRRNNTIDTTGVDSLHDQVMISTYLKASNEPILYNYYLGHDIYRLIWCPFRDFPLIISLHKQNNKVWIESSIISINGIWSLPQEPEPNRQLNREINSQIKKEIVTVREIIFTPNKREREFFGSTMPRVRLKLKREISLKEWTDFEKMLNEYNFQNNKSYKIDSPSIDCDHWFIEGHLKNGYRLIKSKGHSKIGNYLFGLSGLKKHRIIRHASL